MDVYPGKIQLKITSIAPAVTVVCVPVNTTPAIKPRAKAGKIDPFVPNTERNTIVKGIPYLVEATPFTT